MKRDLAALERDTFDVLVVGGGIHGAFAAWDAALRGLRVALIERDDFGGATSSNSLKIAHGGLRHLQSGSLRAVAESLDEQIALRRIAPHLVQPLACVMQTSGITRSPLAMRSALVLYDGIVRARAGRDAAALGPAPGRLLDREALASLTGTLGVDWAHGALWFDALMQSPERILIGVVRAAADAGAVVASRVEAVALASAADGPWWVQARAEAGETFSIAATVVINAAGPWAPIVAPHWPRPEGMAVARAWNVVLRAPAPPAAVALRHPTERRMLFAVPWRGRVMLGTSYAPALLPNGPRPPAAEVEQLLRDVRVVAPRLAVGPDDVQLVHRGLLPVSAGGAREPVSLQSRPLLIEHASHAGRTGLISMLGVKWTTARAVAERAVDAAQRQLGRPVRRGGTDHHPIAGAPEYAGSHSAVSQQAAPATAPVATFRRDLYGTLATEVDAIAARDTALAAPLASGSEVIGAQIVHSIRHEMALHLDDIVLRRTELGTAGPPRASELDAAARIAAAELGWDPPTTRAEVDRVRARYVWETA